MAESTANSCAELWASSSDTEKVEAVSAMSGCGGPPLKIAGGAGQQ